MLDQAPTTSTKIPGEKLQDIIGNLLKKIKMRFLSNLTLRSWCTVTEDGKVIIIKDDMPVAELNKLLDEWYVLYIRENHNLYEFIKNWSYERAIVQNSAIWGGISLKISSKWLPKIH